MSIRPIFGLSHAPLEKVGEVAQAAEAAGYWGLSTAETIHDPFFPLVVAAGTTQRVSLETRIAVAFPRSPMVVAYAAWDLQTYSRGRFRLGLGTQVKGHNERRFSVPWVAPGPRLREYIQSLHAIWECWQEGTPLNFQGQHYSFTLMTPGFSPGPISYPKPSVCIAAVNPYNCRLAGELSDSLMLQTLTSPQYIREAILPRIREGAQKVGRDPGEVQINWGGIIGTGGTKTEVQEAKEMARRRVAFYGSTYTYRPILNVHGLGELGERLHNLSLEGKWEAMAREITDELLEQFAVVGPYEEVGAKIAERYDGLIQEMSLEVGGALTFDAMAKMIQGVQG